MRFRSRFASFFAVAFVGVALAIARAASAQLSPEEALKKMKTAEGLEVTLFAAEPDLVNPTAMDVDADGRVWVTEGDNYRIWKNPMGHPDGDRIRILEDTDGDGRCDKATTFYQDKSLQAPLGIAVLGSRVYVCQSPDLFYLEDTNGDGVADKKTVILTGFGGVDHDHAIHGAMFGPDGHIYMSNGDQGLDVTDKSGGRVQVGKSRPHGAASVLRTDLEGNHIELLAEGLRNPYEPTVDSFGNVFISDNDDDGNEQCRIVHVLEGGNYGYWPSRRGDRHKGSIHWNEDMPGVIPKILRTGFGSPTGLLFYEGTLLPERLRRTLIHADAGPGVIRSYPLKRNGASYDAGLEILLGSDGDKWFRPSDVTVAPDGSVFVCDWYDPGVGGHNIGDFTRGRIYRIAPPKTPYKVKKPDLSDRYGIAAALESPNLATRYLAYDAFQKNKVEGLDGMLRSFYWGRDPVMRARALWLLAGRGEDGQRALDDAKTSADPELRALSLRILASQGADGLKKAKPLVHDPDAGVRRELLLRIAKAGDKADWAKPWLLDLAMAWDGKDRYYREAVGIAMRGKDAWAFAELQKRAPKVWDTRMLGLAFELHPPEALETAAKIAEDKSRSAEDRLLAYQIAGVIGGEEGGRVLLTGLQPSEPETIKIASMEMFDRGGAKPWGSGLQPEITSAFVKLHVADPEFRKATEDMFTRLPGVKKAMPELLKRAEDKNLASAERVAELDAVRRMAASGPMPSAEFSPGASLAKLAADDDSAVAHAALSALGAFRDDKSQQALAEIMQDRSRPAELRKQVVRLMGGSRSGCLLILKLAEDSKLSPDLTLDASAATHGSSFEDIRMMADQILPREQTLGGKPLPPVAELLKMKGDSAQGKQAFYREDRAQCFKCHKIAGEGKDVGPDLSKIGGKYGKDGILEAILNPSAGIAPEYQVWLVRTKSRSYLSGYIKSETADALELMESSGNATRIPSSDIVEKTKSQVSLMPTGLASGMTVQDLADLVEYLSTLK